MTYVWCWFRSVRPRSATTQLYASVPHTLTLSTILPTLRGNRWDWKTLRIDDNPLTFYKFVEIPDVCTSGHYCFLYSCLGFHGRCDTAIPQGPGGVPRVCGCTLQFGVYPSAAGQAQWGPHALQGSHSYPAHLCWCLQVRPLLWLLMWTISC